MKKLYTILFALVAVLGLSAQTEGSGAMTENVISDTEGIGTVTDNTISFTAEEVGLANGADIPTITLVDGTVVTFAQGEGNNAPKYYNTAGLAFRMYAKNELTVTAQKKISYVVVNHTASYGGNETITANAAAISRNGNAIVISGVNASELLLTNEHTATSGGTQLRVVSIEIGYEGAETPSTPEPEEPGEIAGTGEGTAVSPYDVTRALSLIENNAHDANAEIYVAGTISSITEISTQYGNATYNIVDAEGGSALTVFRGYYLGGERFTAEDQLKVGDKVVVCGKLTLYGTTPEVGTGNKVYSINGSTSAGGGETTDPTEPEEPTDPTPGEGVGTVSGNTITFAATDLGLESGAKVTDVTLVDGTVVTFAQGEGNNAPAYYTTGGAAIRMYALNTLTVKAQKAIASVVVKHTAGNGGNETLTASKGTLTRDAEANTITVSGVNVDEVVLCNDFEKNSGGTQLRVVSIEITYVSTGIAGVEQQAAAAATYDLSGRRVAAAGKGLYIVGGKKVLVK